MRKSVVAAVVCASALAFAPAAQAGEAAPQIIGGGTVSSAPWGAQIYWDQGGSQFDGFECSETLAGCPVDSPAFTMTYPVSSVADPPDLQYVLVGRLVRELEVAYPISIVQTDFAACHQGLKGFVCLKPSGRNQVFL